MATTKINTKTEKPHFNELYKLLRDSTDTQLRGYEAEGKSWLGSKSESDSNTKSLKGGVKSLFSGQGSKFKKAEEMMLAGFKSSTNEDASPKIKKMIADAVRGRNEQPLGKAMEKIQKQWATEIADKYSRSKTVPVELQPIVHAALLSKALGTHEEGTLTRGPDMETFVQRFVTNHQTLDTVRKAKGIEEIVKASAERILLAGKMDTLNETQKKGLGDNAAFGTQVFETIESMNLTAEQKQEIHCRIAEIIVASECMKVTDGGTLMRGNNAGSNYLTAYMEKNATEFNKGVLNSVQEGMKTVTMPEVITKDGITPQVIDEGMKNKDQDWSPKFKQGGQIIVDSVQKNTDKLPPQTREFLSRISNSAYNAMVLKDTPKESVAASRTAINNCLILRGALNTIAKEVNILEGNNNIDVRSQATLLKMANNSTQSFCNKSQLSNPKIEKPQDNIAVEMRKDGGVEKLNEFFDEMGKNSKKLEVKPLSVKDNLKLSTGKVKGIELQDLSLDNGKQGLELSKPKTNIKIGSVRGNFRPTTEHSEVQGKKMVTAKYKN